jgi:hypothetical protein
MFEMILKNKIKLNNVLSPCIITVIIAKKPKKATMTIEEWNQVATVKDLEKYHQKTIDAVKGLLHEKQTLGKEFYTPKEFSLLTGIKYSTVVYSCQVGRIQARQHEPNCSWQIVASEVERLKKEAATNTL